MASKKKKKDKKKNDTRPSWWSNNPFTPLTNTDTAWAPPSGLEMPTQAGSPDLGTGGYTAPGSTNQIGQAWEWQGSPELMNMGAQLGGMSATLAQGPQNAFTAEQMAGLKARGMGRIQQDNRNFMTGLAQSSAGRGVVGNSLGGLMQSQLDARRMGSLAGAELDTELAGRSQGLQNYNAQNSALGNMGSLYSGEQSRRFGAQETERAARQNTQNQYYSAWRDAENQAMEFMSKYAAQLNDKPESGDKGKDNLANYRQQFINLRDLANQRQNQYQQYQGGNLLRPRPSGGATPTI